MSPLVRNFLIVVSVALLAIESAWLYFARFDLDLVSLAKDVVIASIPFIAAVFYSRFRKDRRVAAVMAAVAFLLIFAPLCTVLTYFSSTIVGPRIDTLLAATDRALGIDYSALITFAISHPLPTRVLGWAYTVSAFQVGGAVILLGFDGTPQDISKLCVAIAVCALSTILFWTVFPSFGAFTIYDLHAIGAKLHVPIDDGYPRFLNSLFKLGPGKIDPQNAQGLVGFPSFHAEEILLSMWYLRKSRLFFVPAAIFSVIALISTPIQGGHHVVDLIGGALFSIFGVLAAKVLVDRAERRLAFDAGRAAEMQATPGQSSAA